MAKSALQHDSLHLVILESALGPWANAVHWPELMHKVLPDKGSTLKALWRLGSCPLRMPWLPHNATCLECQQDVRKIERQTDRQKARQTERQIEDKTTFQHSYQNKSCSECQQDVKKSVRQTGRYTVQTE